MITMPTTGTAEWAGQPANGQPGASAGSDQTGAAIERGLYVYGIALGRSGCRLGPIGLDQQEVYMVAQSGLSAAVHDCPATPYQSADRQTLEAWILAHQRVVLEVGRRFGTILPMTFNTVVHGRGGTAAESLRVWLAEKHGQFTDLLARLDGKAEYGVQIRWDREVVARTIVETDPDLKAIRCEIAGKPKGLAYMLGQKLAKTTRAAMETWANQTAGKFYEQIRGCVDDLRAAKAGRRKEQGLVLLDLCCLMREGETALGEALDEIALTPGIAVRFTGPWPPYSFVSHS